MRKKLLALATATLVAAGLFAAPANAATTASSTPTVTTTATTSTALAFTWKKTSSSATAGDVWTLSWKPIAGATSYKITAKENGYPAYETKTVLAPKASYSWRYAEDYTFGNVTAYNAAGKAITGKAIPKLPAPAPAPAPVLKTTWKKTSSSATAGDVWTLSWNAIPGATRYTVTAKEDGYPAYETKTIYAPKASYSWRYAEDYTFGKITAYNAAGKALTGTSIPALPATPAPALTPTWKKTSSSATAGDVWTLSWKAIPGATRYTVTAQEDGYPASETKTVYAPTTSYSWRYATDYTFGALVAYDINKKVVASIKIPALPTSK